MLRVGWLNALIIGATILVWLSIIGGVVGTIAVISAINSASNIGNIDLSNDQVFSTPESTPDPYDPIPADGPGPDDANRIFRDINGTVCYGSQFTYDESAASWVC